MFLDLHCHSVSSDDSRATVEQFLKWIVALRKRGHQIDGLVLTEHRKFDRNVSYSPLSNEYGIVILKGSELDTAHGHFLVFGVNDQLTGEVDFSHIRMDSKELVRAAHDSGAIAVPAHPGRVGIGLVNFLQEGVDLSRIPVVEGLNGSAREGENAMAQQLAKDHSLKMTGGSDAHFVSGFGISMTEFKVDIRNEQDLVHQLYEGSFWPVRLEETLSK
jgi:predicted metal-dependent phosphoesterase TrpH